MSKPEIIHVREEGRARPHLAFVCEQCGVRTSIPLPRERQNRIDTTGGHGGGAGILAVGYSAMAARHAERHMAEIGWTHKREFRKLTCAACQPKPEEKPLKTETELQNAVHAPALAPPLPASPVIQLVGAEKPRESTLLERRRITEALDMNYDVNKVRYLGASSDESIAKGLNLPRKWVTDIREQFYGAGSGNEKSDKRAEAAAAMLPRVEAFEAKLLRTLDELATELMDLKGEIKALASK